MTKELRVENFRMGQRVRATLKSGKKTIKVFGKVLENFPKKKTIKIDTKECIYECNYQKITKIQTLSKYILKRILWIFLLFLCLFICTIILAEIEDRKHPKRSQGAFTAAKPIIYLYPTEETNVSIKVGYPEKFTHTYPHYTDGWNVTAKPNGNLKDVKTGRNLYALYWEGREKEADNNSRDGFVIKGENTIPFLEEKLAQLGLNEREADEFIIYWLPKLEDNKYNFIRFQTLEKQNKNMPLMITPKPDTLIRVMMEYDTLDKPITIKEQVLPPTPKRNGFTVVEWGGTEIKI